MEIKEKKSLYRLAPFHHWLLGIGAALLALHFLLRHNRPLMAKISGGFIRPLHRGLAALCDGYGGSSVAEVMIFGFIAGMLALLLLGLWRLIFRPGRLGNLYRLIISLLAWLCFVYALYSVLWGTYYYADDFMDRAGFETEEISAQELRTVTEYFALRLNDYARQVPRDEAGRYVADKEELVKTSGSLYDRIQAKYPVLSGEDTRVRGLGASRLLSYLDFTGFFFPFTGEACVSTDFPAGQFPATIAHELAHQRGVAQEQDANFVAVLASLASGRLDYCYSACYLAYIHLGNALHSADYESWQEIYLGLDEGVLRDMAADREYWQQFETPVQEASNAFHEGLLQSYEQQLGRKSYGACVDALVNYYLEEAREYISTK